ncbi:MAG: hypothetical protein ABL891_09075 [Burkholderiales bacterium]
MRKSWIILGALFAGVIALGLFVWLKPPKIQTVTHALSSLKSADARTVRVLRRGKPLATLEKRNAEWFMTEPIKAPADGFQILRLLAVLDAKSALRYPVSDAAKFELDALSAPQTEIIINDQRFAFGAVNTVTREQYVLSQNQIHPLDPTFGAAVPTDAYALLRRSVLAPGDTPVRFDFGAFAVDYDSKKWNTSPPAGEVSQDDFNRWVAQWREGSGLRTELADQRKPASDINITLKNGARITLGVVQTAPELILRRADLGLQFIFTGDVGKLMISPPAARR